MSARVTLIGTVGREPEYKVSQGGMSYAKFSVATRTGKKLKDGSWAPDRWWDVMVFGPLAEQVNGVVRRGSYLEVEGKFEFEEYKKQDGTSGQSFKCLAERVTEKEKPVKSVHPPQQPTEVEKPMTGWGKAHEQSVSNNSPRDYFDRENHYSSGQDISGMLRNIPF